MYIYIYIIYTQLFISFKHFISYAIYVLDQHIIVIDTVISIRIILDNYVGYLLGTITIYIYIHIISIPINLYGYALISYVKIFRQSYDLYTSI